MYGYIFLTENLANGKKFIGQFASVGFNRKYLGNNPGLISDVEKYGADKFTVKMIRACETKPDYEMAYNAMLAEYNALNDSNFYNCEKKVKPLEVKPVEETEEKPKKSRKKKEKVVEE